LKLVGDQLRFSATDLVGYLNCRHLSGLEHAAAKGEMAKPKYYDPLLEALWERGAKHEHDYVDHLASLGLQVVQIDGVEITDEAVAATIAAMKSGSDVIVQGALRSGDWAGRADILRKVATPSDLGPGPMKQSTPSWPVKPKVAPSFSCAFIRNWSAISRD